jgi:hypothetical protein
VIPEATRVEDIVMRRRDDGTVEVLTTPPLSAINTDLLAQLDPRWRDPDRVDVLLFAPHARYLVGPLQPRTGTHLLRRLP